MKNKLNEIFTTLIASVWLINGLYCKILNQVPRHEALAAKILNTNNSRVAIIIIGVLEVILAIWVFLKYKQKTNAVLQICIVILMNTLEFIYARELLLWKELNMFFALIFIVLVYINAFYFNQSKNKHVSSS